MTGMAATLPAAFIEDAAGGLQLRGGLELINPTRRFMG